MNYIAYDTETYLIASGRVAPRLVCMSVSDGVHSELHARQDALDRFGELVGDPSVTLVVANGSFDMAVLAQAGGDMAAIFDCYASGRVWDVQTWERMYCIAHGTFKTDPITGRRPSFSLAALVDKHLGETIEGKSGPDVGRLRYRELEGVPVRLYPAAAAEYARLDAEYTWRVWAKQKALQDEEGDRLSALSCFKAAVASEFALHLMSAWGIRTDAKAIDALEHSLRTHIEAVKGSLQEAGFLRASGSKNMSAIREAVVNAYAGEGNAPATEKGAVSTSRQTLEESGDDDLALLASVSNDEKLLGTYIPLLQSGTTSPLNPRYYMVESFRTAAQGPNVQNQPRRGGVRECFVARPGWVFITADYAVAELCGLAQILEDRFGQSSMADVLRTGQDIHLWFAAQLMHCTYQEAVDRKAGKYGAELKKLAEDMRQLAKPADFGIPGGLGVLALQAFAKGYGVILTEDEAEALRTNWLEAFPEMRTYFRDAGMEVQLTDFTRHPRTGFVRGGCSYTQWCNHQFQHLVAAMGRQACFMVAREAYCEPESPLYGTRPSMFIHDEIVIECLAEPARYRAAAKRLTEVMVDAATNLIDDIPIQAEPAIMLRWYKGAEANYHEGKLVPWVPKPNDSLKELRAILADPPSETKGWDKLVNKYGSDGACRDYIHTHWHAAMRESR